jgi:hypothetical protein
MKHIFSPYFIKSLLTSPAYRQAGLPKGGIIPFFGKEG